MQKHRILPASMKPSLFVFKGITGNYGARPIILLFEKSCKWHHLVISYALM